MGYHVKRERVKGKQKRKGPFTVRHEDGTVTAKGTTLKSALYQRVMLNTIEELRTILKHHDITEVYKRIRNPKLDKLRPGGVMDTSKVVMDPYEVSDSDEEKEETTKSPRVTPGQSASSSGSTARANHRTQIDPQPDPEKEEARKHIEKFGPPKKKSLQDIPHQKPLMQTKQIKNIDLIDQQEREKYDKREPLTKEELRTARPSVVKLIHGDGKMSDKQRARVEAWLARAEHNKQKLK